jgi:hypothetical protein
LLTGVAEALKRIRRFLALGAALLVTLGLGWVVVRALVLDPQSPFLLDEGESLWIRLQEAPHLRSRAPESVATTFRVFLSLDRSPHRALLQLRAMRRAEVRLDERLVFRSASRPERLKEAVEIDLAPLLRSGSHEIRITVENHLGPPALWLCSPDLGLFSGPRWEASRDGQRWSRAWPARDLQPAAISRQFPRAEEALWACLPWLLPVFLLGFAAVQWGSRLAWPRWLPRGILTAGGLRFGLLFAWLVLGAHNLLSLPLFVGMDVRQHLEYVQVVAEEGRLPLPTEGWQMFQPPLFYLLCAPLYHLFQSLSDPETTLFLLRVLPLACGAAQVEICYRALREVYPREEGLQALGTLLGGLLPMNLYVSQVVGNEPLAGCLSGMLVVLALRCAGSPAARSWRRLFLLGLLLGLAALAKTSALLLVPPLVLLLGQVVADETPGRRAVLASKQLGVVLGTALLVGGWYYLRNWIELGRPFLGGWDPARAFVWWQEPGYRTVSQLLTFGESLSYPVYSALAGVWDSLYSTLWMDGLLSGISEFRFRPPWDYDLVLAGAWLSLVPSAALIAGVLLGARRESATVQRAILFARLGILLFLGAVLFLFVTVPIYSTAKASYALGLTPCLALLFVAGVRPLWRWRLLRAALSGWMVAWALASYLAYFAR